MANVNLEVRRGDTAGYDINFVDKDNAPVDITGWTVYFTVKEKIEDEDSAAKIKKEISSHTNPTEGETTITLTSLDTALEPKPYLFDIRVKTNLNEVKTIIPEGHLTITKAVRQTIT